MKDVILAAAGEAAEASTAPARDTIGQVETGAEVASRVAQAHASGMSEGLKQGQEAERARIRAIIGSEQAKGREDLAAYFAFETDMAADMTTAALARSPIARASLDSAMAKEAQPKLGTGGDHLFGQPPRIISTEDVYARRRAAVAAASKH